MARVGVAAWRAAYRGLMPDAYLDGLDERPRAERWRSGLRAGGGEGRMLVGDDRCTALVAEDDVHGVAGFVSLGGLRDRSAQDQPTGELWALNVHPQAWGCGLGTELLRRAVADLTAAGHDAAALWVVAGNHRARSFYERAGWHATDVVRTDLRFGEELAEVRYDRVLR